MRQSRFTQEQIVAILNQSENEYRWVTTRTEDGEESINRYHLIWK